MCKVSVGSVSKILFILTQSLYVVQYKRSTLTNADDFLVTTESYYYRYSTITLSQMYVCHSITHVGCSGMLLYYFLMTRAV